MEMKMNNPTKIEEFVTKDLHIVSYLLTKGFRFSQPPKAVDENSNLIYFYFSKTEDFEATRQDFYDRKGMVDAATVLERYHNIKNLVWGIRKGIYGDGNEKDRNPRRR
jgi:hypothetical protein